MSTAEDRAEALLGPVLAAPRAGRRRLVALAGPPASGKSTVAELLVARLNAAGCSAAVVPMDGFHLDNRILERRDLLARKGCPESFDHGGLLRLVRALSDSPQVFYPIFDRARDIAIAGAGEVAADCDTLVVEGNYLLYDAPGWRDLQPCWDVSIRLDVPEAVLHRRLVDRWLGHGLSPDAARARAEGNDLRNARLVAAAALPADVTLSG